MYHLYYPQQWQGGHAKEDEKGEWLTCERRRGWDLLLTVRYATYITYGMRSDREGMCRTGAAKGNGVLGNAAEFGTCFRHW